MARLVEVGSRPEGDLLQLKAQLASDQQNAVSTANAVVLSLVQLANLLQLEDPTGFDVVAPQMKLPGADLVSREALSIYNSAVEIQPAVKAAEKRRQSQEQAVAVARSGYVPTLSLIGQVGSNFSDQIPNITGSQMQVFPIGVVQSTGDIVNSVQQVPISDGVKPFTDQFTDNINELVGLSLQVPIFNRMQVKNNVQNAQVNQEIARLNLEQEKNSLRQTIFQAHADAKAALRQYQAAAQAEEANQKAFDYAKQRFEVGAINQVDFENAKNSLAQAQSQKAQARFDYIFKIKVLEFYLTNQVNL
jgi:outer membrane protein